MSQTSPPMVPGNRLLGNFNEFRKYAPQLLQRGHQQHGPVFALRLGPKKIAALIGAEHNRFFFSQTDKILSIREIYQWMVPVFGDDDFTLAAEREKYLRQQRLGKPLYATNRMQGYLDAMAREMQGFMQRLGDEGEFDLVHELGVLTMYMAARAFVGDHFRERLGEDFRRLFEDLAAGVEFILPPNLPLPRFIRGNRARRKINEMISGYLRERRQRKMADDTLQFLMDYRDDDIGTFNDGTLASMIPKLIFGGHETTQSQLSWFIITLLQNPSFVDRLLTEQRTVLPSEDIRVDQLKDAVLLEAALLEAERLRPVAFMLMRQNTSSYEVNGFHVPSTWMTLISPMLSHRQPDLYPDPDTFNPDRFSSERDRERVAARSLVGFGGGRHKCPGMHIARNNMKGIATLLFRNYELELANPHPRPKPGPVFLPEHPCIIRYRRRALA